jgi:hypothetical protein
MSDIQKLICSTEPSRQAAGRMPVRWIIVGNEGSGTSDVWRGKEMPGGRGTSLVDISAQIREIDNSLE